MNRIGTKLRNFKQFPQTLFVGTLVTCAAHAQTPHLNTIVLSVYNTGQRFMLYPMPFGKNKPDSVFTVPMVAALDTVNVQTMQPDSAGLPVRVWRTARQCGKIAADVRGKIALMELLDGCDVSAQVLAAQRAGALVAVVIHTTNNRDSVTLPRQAYAMMDSIRIPCYTIRKGLGEKIRTMMPSLASVQVVDGLVGNDVQTRVTQNRPPNPVVSQTDGKDARTLPPTEHLENQGFMRSIGLQLTPNPAHTTALLEYHFPDKAHTLVEVFNETGQLVTTYDLPNTESGQLTIDVEQWQSGAYNVRVKHDNVLEIKRFVVIH
jgi:hypothetical protein